MMFKPREELHAKIIAGFAALDEVYRICIFGKEAEGKADAYSDIDLIVYSNDVAKTYQQYCRVLASVAPVLGTFALGGETDWYAESIMFDGYSPYQKVDFSIGLGLDPAKVQLQVVYDCLPKARESQTTLAPAIIRHDTAYRLYEQLFAVPRFTKCLFRRDPSLYQRWTGLMNRALLLLYEQHFGWVEESEKVKLYPYEINKLWERLSAGEKQQVEIICPTDGKLDAALSYQTGIDLMIALSREKAQHFGVGLNEPLIAYVWQFLVAEFARFGVDKVLI